MGWDKSSERELDGWVDGDSHNIDDATLEEELLGNEGGVWKRGSSLHVG